MTTSQEHGRPEASRSSARRLTVGALVCGVAVVATPSSAFATHDAASAMDGMGCPHAAAGSGPSQPGAAPDAPARGASTAPISAPASSSSAPSAPAASPPAPQAKAAAPPVQAKASAPAARAQAPAAAAQRPAQRQAAAPTAKAESPAAVTTASAAGSAAASGTRTVRRSVESAPARPRTVGVATMSARRSSVARTGSPQAGVPARAPYMARIETRWSAPAVVRAPASVSATTANPDTSPGLLTMGIGLVALSVLAGGFALLRWRGGGSATGVTTTVGPTGPATLDAFDLALYEMISEVDARPSGATATDDRELSRT